MFFEDFLHAERQSVYVPNYQRAFDYNNFDETPLTLQHQQDEDEIQFNEALDLLQAASSSSDELPSQTDPIPVKVSTERTISSEETTYALNTISESARERIPSAEKRKKMIDRSNKTQKFHRPSKHNYQHGYSNRTLEQAAQFLANQKLVRSLMHLIPPSLWAQLQNNRSGMHHNQTQFFRPPLPNPVLFPDTVAQAGLPNSGAHSVPEHLWYRYPPQIAIRSTTKCKCIQRIQPSSLFIFS